MKLKELTKKYTNNSINIPKSYKCNSLSSSSTATFWDPIAWIKASFVGYNTKEIDIEIENKESKKAL